MVRSRGSLENVVVNTEFWAGKRVFLTGHTGFKGAWCSILLTDLGAEVFGFALEAPTEPSLFELAGIDGLVARSVLGDVRNRGHLASALDAAAPDVVIHMAAQSLVHASYADPVETYATNVMGTVNLLDVLRARKTPCVVVNVTSDKCYENQEWEWAYRENEPMGGHDPYSNSKGCAELVTSAFRNSFMNDLDIRLASGRAGNVIGGGDWADNRLVPDILRAHDAGEKVEIRSPDAIRPWQHVLEPVSGYLQLAEKLAMAEVVDVGKWADGWNFGPDESDVRTVRWIARNLFQHLDNPGGVIIRDNPLHEAKLLKLDSSKARMKLGWQPRWTADTALENVAEWHKAYRNGANVLKTTRDQIAAYLGTSA